MSTLVRKRSTVSSDLTADIVCRILQEEITDDKVQRLKAVGELLNYNFQSGDVANHIIDKQALHDNQAVLRKLFDFSTVFSKVVLQTGIEKYDRRIGVCIKSCREDASILKRMQMDCRFFGVLFSRTFCCWGSQSLQADMSWASCPMDSSPTRKDKFERFLRSLVV